MSAVKINLSTARTLLAQAVDTQGSDFVYNPGGTGACYYTPQPGRDGPQAATGCVVGVALKLAGLDEEFLSILGGSAPALPYADPEKLLLTKEATTYFAVAQKVQDDGGTWGQALNAAETYAEMTWNTRADDDYKIREGD